MVLSVLYRCWGCCNWWYCSGLSCLRCGLVSWFWCVRCCCILLILGVVCLIMCSRCGCWRVICSVGC